MGASTSFHGVLCLLLTLFIFRLPSSYGTSHAFLPLKLVTDAASEAVPVQTILTYHHGSLLSGPKPINLYLIWYGNFSSSQKSIIADFFSSFSTLVPSPNSVSSWWKTTNRYRDKRHSAVSPSLHVQAETSNDYSRGKILHKPDIAKIVRQALFSGGAFQADPTGVYFVLTSDDVAVDEFCMSTCGFHDHMRQSRKGNRLVYAWVGNSAKQCSGQCAWPFAAPEFGPPAVLTAPNRDVGIDGMIINIATLLAGAATNPLANGYFQGDPRAPMEAVSACTGIFGTGAFPGNPGALLVDNTSGASYNALGHNNRMFLLPGMWDPSVKICSTLS